MSRFPRGSEFPHEGFVQDALTAWFGTQGFEVAVGQATPDILARHPDGRVWHVEAKGRTTAVGLDFRTGLGQLLQGMHDRAATFAMGLPDTPQFRSQCQRVPAWTRAQLSLWWLLVAEDGSVTAVGHDDPF